jgi:hypothetical protein
MAQDLSNTAEAALRAQAEALLGKDLNRIVRRAADVFGKVALDQQDAIVEAALAKASAAVIEEISARKFNAESEDVTVVTIDADENDVGIDLNYLARIKAELSLQAWRLVRDFLLPRTVWRAISNLATVH